MATCIRCGKKGLFLKLDHNDLCSDCHEILVDQNNIVQEAFNISQLTTDPQECFDNYDLATTTLEEICKYYGSADQAFESVLQAREAITAELIERAYIQTLVDVQELQTDEERRNRIDEFCIPIENRKDLLTPFNISEFNEKKQVLLKQLSITPARDENPEKTKQIKHCEEAWVLSDPDLNDMELLFLNALKKELDQIGAANMFTYNIMSDKTINCQVDGMQIGRIKLNGKKYKMQLLTDTDIDWLEISSVDEAMQHIPQWVEYSQYLLDDDF